MFNIIPFMCNIYNTNHYMQNQKIAGYFTPATASFIHKKTIHFIPSFHFPHPYKNRSPTPITPPQFAPLYRTSSPPITVLKALPWQMKSTFIIKFSCSHLAIARCRDIRQIATYASIVVIFLIVSRKCPVMPRFARFYRLFRSSYFSCL